MIAGVLLGLSAVLVLAQGNEHIVLTLTAHREENILAYPDPKCKSEECFWKIESSETEVVSIEFAGGKLFETDTECDRSFVEAYDGTTLKSARLTQLCFKEEKEMPIERHHCTPSSARHIFIRMRHHPEDHSNGIQHPFKVVYKSVPAEHACRPMPPMVPPPHMGQDILDDGRNHHHKPGHHGHHGHHGHRPGSGSDEDMNVMQPWKEPEEETHDNDRDCDESKERMQEYKQTNRRCKHHKRKMSLIVGVGAGVFGLLIITVIAGAICRQRYRRNALTRVVERKVGEIKHPINIYEVSFSEEKKIPPTFDTLDVCSMIEKNPHKLEIYQAEPLPEYVEIASKLEQKLLAEEPTA